MAAYYCYKYSLKKATELLKKYPLPSKEAGCIWSGGSIGQAVSVGCGLAIADRTKDVYVLIGDGDMQEGQTYEALLFKSHHKLDNLKVYVDMNKLQACGAVKDILCTPDWFFEKLGVNLIETTKGRGVPFIEKMGYKNHYYNLDETGYAQALRELADKKGQKR